MLLGKAGERARCRVCDISWRLYLSFCFFSAWLTSKDRTSSNRLLEISGGCGSKRTSEHRNEATRTCVPEVESDVGDGVARRQQAQRVKKPQPLAPLGKRHIRLRPKQSLDGSWAGACVRGKSPQRQFLSGIRSQVLRELLPGQRMIGYECTIGVDSADAIAELAQANGGKVVMAKTIIPTVGELVWLRDPEGNVFGAMKYDEQRKQRMKR